MENTLETILILIDRNDVLSENKKYDYFFPVQWLTTFCCSYSSKLFKVSLQLFKLLNKGQFLSFRILINWFTVDWVALRIAANSLWSYCKKSDKISVMVTTSSKKRICCKVSTCISRLLTPINSALGSLKIISSKERFYNNNIALSTSLTSCSMRQPWCNGSRKQLEFHLKYLFLLLKWKAFHSPSSNVSIVSNHGKTLRKCLKQSARRWLRQFMYIECDA